MKKFFTLLAATSLTIAANAESTTATFGSANNSDKDTEVRCPGFTIDGTYVASGTSKAKVYGKDTGMKMRANQTSNTLKLSVDKNTTITSLVMGVVTNDATQTLPISNVLVDGTSVDLVYPIDTYNTTNADGSAVITLTNIEATETIDIQFNLDNYTAKNKQVFIAGEVTYEEATEAEPTFPEHIDYTLNGEKELAGVTVDQTMDQGSLSINVTGTSSADEITLTFETPAGWDGLLIAAPYGELSEIEFAKTRSEDDWMSLEDALLLPYGFQKANSITFPVDEEGSNFAWMALIKDDMVYQSIIDINFEVTPAESDAPVFPEYFVVDTFNDNFKVTQGFNRWGSYDIVIEGEIFADTFPIVVDVPEGWDGFVCYNWSHEGDVTITENDPMSKVTRAEDELEWISVEKLLAHGYVKGNRFTFEPTFIPGNNNSQDISLHLYKGDRAIADDILTLSVCVSKSEGPAVPESFEVSVNPAGLTVTQGEEYGVYTINVEGECPDDEVEVTLEVPEGWDGFLGMTDSDYDEGDAEPLKKVQASEWDSMDNILAYGFKETNTLTFKVDGEAHSGALYLYKSGLVDRANYIAVYSDVKKSQGVGVDTVETAAGVRFFNLQGAEVANPEPGIYVKKENGKTTKVVLK